MATFGIFILISKSNNGVSLSVATAFTSLSLINLLSDPLGRLSSAIPRFATSLACFDRIQEFLNSDSRLQFNSTSIQSPRQGNDFAALLREHTTEGIELGVVSSATSSFRKEHGDETTLVLKNASFGLKADGASIIHNISIQVKKNSLNLIVGTVGSGKSTLLKGMLGELPCISGNVDRAFTTAAYCDQQSWLVKDTIQNNIIGESSFSSTWYESVVHACDLDQDFARLPQGDHSVIGSKGITLSGGQKQRVVSNRISNDRSQKC
jgi:ATP-binding cassette subfamily C (CFTR/MRP) protein 1